MPKSPREKFANALLALLEEEQVPREQAQEVIDALIPAHAGSPLRIGWFESLRSAANPDTVAMRFFSLGLMSCALVVAFALQKRLTEIEILWLLGPTVAFYATGEFLPVLWRLADRRFAVGAPLVLVFGAAVSVILFLTLFFVVPLRKFSDASGYSFSTGLSWPIAWATFNCVVLCVFVGAASAALLTR